MTAVWNHGLIGLLFPEDAPLWTMLFVLLPIAAGYLLGSVNTSILLSKFVYHDDIRKYGSGNAGMTNVMRTWGKGAAAVTFIGDLAKTALAVVIGRLLMGETGMYLGGFAAVCGHVWPCFFGFRGGKGVTAALALVLFTEPIVALILLGVFVCIVAATKFISLGSVMCVMMYPLFLNRMYMILHHTSGVPFIPTLVSFCLMVVVIVRHRENIRRLMKGQENKFSFKKSVKPKDGAAANADGTAEAEAESDAAEEDASRSEKPDPNTARKKLKKKNK